MNYLIQRGKVRGQVINVPDGLPEILSDITREVLRCQPTKECLCQFIMDYLHSVILTREKALVAKSIIDRALRKVDEIISDMCICDITKEKAEEMAIVMEDCFKRFLEKRRCERGKEREIIKFDEEDVLDELIKKCRFSEHELMVSRPLIEDAYNRFVQAYMQAAENTDGTEALYQYFRERELRRWEDKIRTEAATKIQANFRGYMVRRSLIEKLLPKLPHGYKIGLFGEVPSELYHEMDKAARVIQRFFKDRFPFMDKFEADGGVIQEEGEGSICSNLSKETVIGEPYAQTAPDERPMTEPETEGPTEIESHVVETEVVIEEEPTAVEEPAPVPKEPEPEPAPAPVEETPPAPEPEPEPPAAPEPAAPEEDVPAEGPADDKAPDEPAAEPPAEE